MNKEDKINQAHTLIINLFESVLERTSKKWGEINLSLSQVRLLFVLKRLGKANIGEIARKLNIGQSAASLLVDGLVRKNLILRSDNPEDRRKAIVQMTTVGEELSGKRQVRRKRWLEWLTSMDDKKIEMTIETLKEILEMMSENDHSEENYKID